MNKAQLIDAMNDQIGITRGITKKDIDTVLDALGAVATEVMKTETGEIPLPGLGKLKAATRAARKGVNPATGAEIDIPAKNTAKFVPSKALLDAIA
jgi:DNA-binding protein HU-beta